MDLMGSLPQSCLRFAPIKQTLSTRDARLKDCALDPVHVGTVPFMRVSEIPAVACGSAAGAVAATVTTPLDVLKTRVMSDLRVSTPS